MHAFFPKIAALGFLLALSTNQILAATVTATMNVQYNIDNGAPVSLTFNGNGMDTYGLEFSPVSLDFNFDGTYDLETIAYCVELDQGIADNDTHTVDLVTATGNYLAAAWIMDTYAGSGIAEQNAAVQVAVWETVYDGQGGSLSSGTFELTSASTNVEALAESYITALVGIATFDGLGLERYMVAQHSSKQDLLVALPPSPVPVPGAIWLMGSGLLALIGFSKARKSA